VDEPYGTPAAPGPRTTPQVRLEVLLDNIRSLRNVGSIFRTADGAGVGHLHLGGITPTPDHPKLAKTALGAELEVPWTHVTDAAAHAASLVQSGHRLWALEGGDASDSLFEARPSAGGEDAPIVLVLGHEVSGVDPRILRLCERVIHIPMLGIKDSLNVSVAFGVAVYWLRFA
jgi:tRNA G18 (ribose-2'-O)-methylase SpoU